MPEQFLGIPDDGSDFYNRVTAKHNQFAAVFGVVVDYEFHEYPKAVKKYVDGNPDEIHATVDSAEQEKAFYADALTEAPAKVVKPVQEPVPVVIVEARKPEPKPVPVPVQVPVPPVA